MMAEMAAKFKSHKWQRSLGWIPHKGMGCVYRCKRCKAEFAVERDYYDRDMDAPRSRFLDAGIRANCNEMVVASIMAE